MHLHIEFEKTSSETHQDFLESIDIEDEKLLPFVIAQ